MNITYRRIKALLFSCVIAVTTACSEIPAMAEEAIISAPSESSSSPSSPSIQTSAANISVSSGTTLWVVGDSTAASFNDTNYYSPRYGWGTQLGLYIQGLNIQNLAVSGTSSKSYLDTEQYRYLVNNIKSGDYLLIGFGHNDERAELGRYTSPSGSPSVVGSFQYYLYENYILVAREHGATPVLVTPIVRRDTGNNYNGESGHITTTVTNEEGTFQGGDYAKAIWQLGVGKSVTVLDLTARTKAVYEQLGADGVKNRHAWTSQREASIDNTHTNLYGAQCNAWFIADELLNSSCDLKNYVISNPQVPEYTSASINAAYHEQAFSAPTSLSTLWPSIGDWKATVFGDIDGPEYLNYLYFNLSQEGNGIRMAVGESSGGVRSQSVGKIAQASDGIAMYYREVPAGSNFTLSADVTIHAFDANNQASFGLMVRDDIYLDTIINDTMGDYVAAAPLMLGSSEPWNCFARKNGVLTRGDGLQIGYNPGDTVHVTISKGTDGYTCQFGDNPAISAGFDFALTAVDPNYVYVGMFVARNADITFQNVTLTYQ